MLSKNAKIAKKLVNEAIKDHDDGAYAYVGMNEILETKITILLNARATRLKKRYLPCVLLLLPALYEGFSKISTVSYVLMAVGLYLTVFIFSEE